MQKQTSLPVSNNTASGATVGLIALGMGTNYSAQCSNSGSTVTLTNTTTDFDTEERFVLTFRALPIVNTRASSSFAVDEQGVQYSVETSNFLRTEWVEGEGESGCCCKDDITDEPIVIKTTIRHTRSSNVTAALIQQALTRHFSAFFTDAGTSRLNDWMRGNLTHSN